METLCNKLLQLSEPIKETLRKTNYNPPENSNFSVKSNLESLLPNIDALISEDDEQVKRVIRDFCLCCAALASSEGEKGVHFSWIPRNLSESAAAAIAELSTVIFCDLDRIDLRRRRDLSKDFDSVSNEHKLVIELMPTVLPLLKGVIKDSAVDAMEDEVSASCARVPVTSAIVAANQFRWFVTQVEYPYLGKLCALVIPCALTALDHWSPEVKGQGVVSFVHLIKNVNAAELGSYADVILDASCRNIVCSDELWHSVVEMSVLLVTSIQRRNPRSSWFERMLSEMLGHLERQPKSKERRIAWLQLIEPVFNAMGLVIVAHFRRIFPLLFRWMHADDDETVLLVGVGRCCYTGESGVLVGRQAGCSKEGLKLWNKAVVGLNRVKIDGCLAYIVELDAMEGSVGWNEDLCRVRTELKLEVDKWLKMDEIEWKQKLRDKFVKLGDKNTKYFYTLATFRKKSKCLEALELGGRVVLLDGGLEEAIHLFFQSNFSRSTWDRYFLPEGLEFDQISYVDRGALEAPFVECEIVQVIAKMKADSSLGPDGFNVRFFKECWSVVGETVLKMFEGFHATGFLDGRLNNCLISLIPKKPSPASIDDFRPISVINTAYRILVKTLSARMSSVLPKIISPEQGAFVRGRLLLNGSTVSVETLHSLSISASGGLVCMLNMSKAYDRVEWSFLEYVL